MAIRSVVRGTGAYLPANAVSNEDLSRRVETSDEWIVARTGIRQRHIAAEGEMTSHLALKASERALEPAGLKASDLDLNVLATATPDETFPATATRVHESVLNSIRYVLQRPSRVDQVIVESSGSMPRPSLFATPLPKTMPKVLVP